MKGQSPAPPVRTTCPYCGVGCGVLAAPSGSNSAVITGDPDHPANYSRLCSKGTALGDTLGQKGRLLAPHVNGQRVNWDRALDHIAGGFRQAIDESGQDSVAFYLSGQLLTEDYYVANKLMKGFIGSANVDTNSRLCMASAVVAYKRAFGSDTVPCDYQDLDQCDLLVLIGSNLAWCHPVLYQRIVAQKANRPSLKIVVIDPRVTATADIADLHLALKPGSDIPLWQGLFRHLCEAGCHDQAFTSAHTNGVDEAIAAARSIGISQVAQDTGLSVSKIKTFYALFAATEKVVSVYSMGVNQSKDGTDKANAIINAHLLTGRIGRAGCGPFSMTGQPNAMGGREVGGLANQFTCHMDFDPASLDRVGRFWETKTVATKPGLQAVDMFDAVVRGDIKAIWIMATNPAVSMPDADAVKAALKACPLAVVSDIYPDTDTAKLADVLLPATGWGEKDGTVTNSERRISRQRAFLPAPGLARHDWRAICDVAKRLGFSDAFSFETPASIFREYAALTAFENDGTRDLDLGPLAALSDDDYDALRPKQWPLDDDDTETTRPFADGRFYTPDQRARFIVSNPSEVRCKPQEFILNTGRARDQWHTMTRTGRAPQLNRHSPEPVVEMHPADAAGLQIGQNMLVSLENDLGHMIARAHLTENQHRGEVFAPMHWTAETSAAARVDALVAPTCDPHSGQPALKSASVTASRFPAAWHGFSCAMTFSSPQTAYWAKVACERGARMELADRVPPRDWGVFCNALWGQCEGAKDTTQISSLDKTVRIARVQNARLVAFLIAGPEPVEAAREWLAGQLGRIVTPGQMSALLSGFPPEGVVDSGPTVCACMGVGEHQITSAIKKGAASVLAIGNATSAGTSCGSCRPELQKMLEADLVPA